MLQRFIQVISKRNECPHRSAGRCDHVSHDGLHHLCPPAVLSGTMFGVATRMDFGAVTTDCNDRRLSAHHCAGADNCRSNDDAKCHQDSLEGLTESIPAAAAAKLAG